MLPKALASIRCATRPTVSAMRRSYPTTLSSGGGLARVTNSQCATPWKRAAAGPARRPRHLDEHVATPERSMRGRLSPPLSDRVSVERIDERGPLKLFSEQKRRKIPTCRRLGILRKKLVLAGPVRKRT